MTGSLICGCGRPKNPGADDKIIAKINNYTLTAGDFRDSAAKMMGGTKEAVLDELITKNVLIQEAQKENFDKDRAFMNEIEKYWEQALLKLLIKKKMAEFYVAFKGDQAKVKEAMDRWVKYLRAHSKVKIYKENFDKIKVP